MKRRFCTIVALLALLVPLLAQQAPPEIQAVLDQAVQAANNGDATALQAVSTGDPKTLYRWVFRPQMPMMDAPGFGRRTWKAGALQIPNDPTGTWWAVFWDVHPCESTGDHVHKLVREGNTWKIGEEIPETETFGFRIRDHQINVTFDLPNHVATFTNNVLIERVRSDANTLQIRLSSDFKVSSITHRGKPVKFVQVGGVIYAVPPEDKKFTLAMQYQGTVHHPDMFVSNFVDPSEIVLTAYWYPVIARLPATNTVTATVPKGWTAISQGNLIFRSNREENSVFTYRMDVPNCYFTFDAGPYYIYSKDVNGRTYNVYMLKPDYERAEKQLDMMDSSFQLFEKIWGPYPYDHYTIVETQQRGFGGALEAYTFTTYGRGLMPSPDPHEWGHTWWGGFVPCTYLQDIWNESFATYSSSVYHRYGEPGASEVQQKIHWSRPFPGMEMMTSAMSLAETADALYGPSSIVGYGKGALVMQNLEETLGFDLLMKCMRTFRDAYYKSGEAATWADFERIVNRVTKKNYKWWFDQWVRRKGLPKLKWENVTMKRTGSRYEVTAELVQEGEPYRLKVPVWLETKSGETVKTSYEIAKARTRVRLTASSEPTRLILDPEIRLPRAITAEDLPSNMSSFIFGQGGGGQIIVVTAEKTRGTAERIASFGGGMIKVKSDSEVKEEDLKDASIILLGSPDSNQLWARWASHCPFKVGADGVTFKGKTHQGANAFAMTANPLNPSKELIWLTEGVNLFGMMTPANVAVFDDYGRLVDAETGIARGGLSVYEFGK